MGDARVTVVPGQVPGGKREGAGEYRTEQQGLPDMADHIGLRCRLFVVGTRFCASAARPDARMFF